MSPFTRKCTKSVQLAIGLFCGLNLHAIEDGNPLVDHIYTADPSAHVFEGRVYVYPSHDQDNANTYNMTDYHVLSSADLVNWTDHGVALDVVDVEWATNRMWAPDCAYKDGTYYFYFPAREGTVKKIGVATSSSPAGPFIPEDEAIDNSFEIDPAVFVDDDGQVYMYFGGHSCNVAKMGSTMKQFDGDVVELTGLDYFYEAAWMHKRNGIYYLSYSTGSYLPDTNDHLIGYATSTSPMGPFTYQGVVNGDVSGITNHHSIVEYQGQWYLFYHNSDLSGGINTRRSVVADYLHYNDDGSIRQVIQTNLGIGQYNGMATIEAENYTKTENVEKRENNSDGGLHTVFDPGDELVFTNIDLGFLQTDTVQVKVATTSSTGSLEVRTESGDLLGTGSIPQTSGSQVWQTISIPIVQTDGVFNLLLAYTDTATSELELDKFSFAGEIVEPEVPDNLALTGTATQSSTDYSAAASRAIDDDTDGDWNNGSVTHTETEDQPWWRVDLGSACNISEIRIWGRTLSSQDRLSNYDVTILNMHEEPVWSSYQENYPNPMVSLDTGLATGQYVMIQLRDNNALSLAEVQVFGSALQQTDLVLADWPMDEASGADVPDMSGNGFNASVVGESWVSGLEGNALDFNGISSSMSPPSELFDEIYDAITLSIWVYGDDTQPRSDTLFHANDAVGNRVFNIHLPWNNGKVYWDAGNNGDDVYDRILMDAVEAEFMGRWNHWVFTKDATVGEMKIYLNGILWHSGIDNFQTMGGIESAFIGSGDGADYYDGMLDQVKLYNFALTAAEVNELYNDYQSVHAWMSHYPAMEEMALDGDPDSDSIPTLLEYVFMSDPTVFNEMVSFDFESTKESLVFKFDRRSESDLRTTQIFQYSSDLVAWDDIPLNASLPAEVSIGTVIDESEEVTVTISKEVVTDGQLFWRLKAAAE